MCEEFYLMDIRLRCTTLRARLNISFQGINDFFVATVNCERKSKTNSQAHPIDPYPT